MKPIELIFIICVLTILSAACAGTVENTSTANGNFQIAVSPSTATPRLAPTVEFAAARATYNATCVNCHKQNGEGGIADFGGGEKLEVPSFKTGRRLTDTDEEFARQIANGGGGMPAFGKRLTPEQINELVRFVRHEFHQGLIKN
ncbi:MAG TPA: cytochrome c [Pyrinomonadaceae bacterium]|nr:cytochrome c [Pyrinomonadaceae bacterium]